MRPQRLPDMLKNRLNVEHRVIRNSENPYPYAGDSPVARFVVLPLLLMHTAIELDRQFGSVAIKVSDVPFDHLLSAEMKSVQRISAKGAQSRRSAGVISWRSRLANASLSG